jgi:hypothetical protein
MVYEFLRDCFVLNDYANGFDILLKICEHITHAHVLPLVSCLLVTSQLLALEETSWSRLTHRNWRGDLSINHSHASYSV